MKRIRRIRARLRGAVAVSFILGVALGGAKAGPADLRSAERHAELLPGDIDLYLSVDDAARWRGSAVGPPMQALLISFLVREDAEAAWADFANQLDLGPEEAFDRILGRRFTFAQRATGVGPSTWVIVSEVEHHDAKLLRQSLKTKPRGMREGMNVLTFEGGRFQMIIAEQQGRSIVILGPAEAPQLFDDVTIRERRREQERLTERPAFRQLDGIAKGSTGRILMRLPEEDVGWLGMAALPGWDRLAIDLVLKSEEIASATQDVEFWARQPALDLDDDSLLAAMEWSIPTKLPLSVLGAIDRFVPDAPKAFEQPKLIAQRRAIVLDPSEDAIARLAIGFESSDLRALAPIGDRFIADSLEPLWGGVQSEHCIDLEGQFPSAMRRVDLSGNLGRSWPDLFDDGPALCWRFIERHGKANAGWWAIASDPDQLERVSEALEEDRRGVEPEARWVSVGAARPKAALEALAARDMGISVDQIPFVGVLERIDLMLWGVFRDFEGALRGRIELRIAWGGR